MRAVGLALFWLCGVAVADGELDERVAQADKAVARRFASLAMRAEKAKQYATARRLAERVLRLDPENSVARAALGFKRVGGTWSRASAAEAEIERREDGDLARVAKYREEREALELVRAKELLRARST
jgi:hypothetical protein